MPINLYEVRWEEYNKKNGSLWVNKTANSCRMIGPDDVTVIGYIISLLTVKNKDKIVDYDDDEWPGILSVISDDGVTIYTHFATTLIEENI